MAFKPADSHRQNLYIPNSVYYRLIAQSGQQRTPPTTLMNLILEHACQLLESGDAALIDHIQNRHVEAR
ncbi:hypothetical protein [Kushneria aurantia]|uniref:CopG family transcriptional regulator n=1 Tax=Kushneria aurantia TaxID=504092 RepID=A0ABV6G2S2_9GAMM|nr:hypothetical protein [Kushneria aurantia]